MILPTKQEQMASKLAAILRSVGWDARVLKVAPRRVVFRTSDNTVYTAEIHIPWQESWLTELFEVTPNARNGDALAEALSP